MANHDSRALLNSVGVPDGPAAVPGGVPGAEALTRTDWVLIAWALFFACYALWCVLFEPYEMSVTRSMRDCPLVVKLLVVGFTMFLWGHWWYS